MSVPNILRQAATLLETANKRLLKLMPVRSQHQLADIFTKALPSTLLSAMLSKMAVKNLQNPSCRGVLWYLLFIGSQLGFLVKLVDLFLIVAIRQFVTSSRDVQVVFSSLVLKPLLYFIFHVMRIGFFFFILINFLFYCNNPSPIVTRNQQC